jgi:hypothetical protein
VQKLPEIHMLLLIVLTLCRLLHQQTPSELHSDFMQSEKRKMEKSLPRLLSLSLTEYEKEKPSSFPPVFPIQSCLKRLCVQSGKLEPVVAIYICEINQ